ncbi:MAG: NAD(P)/FAD-dependent oxidoreductase [Egibacteraceae bacterium]
MTPTACTVLIVGSGPAGLFAADHLRRAGVTNVVIVDKGKPMPSRFCPDNSSCECALCDVLEGEGGAGSFSDGKITLSAMRGTHAQRLFTSEQAALLAEVEATIRKFVPEGMSYAPVSSMTALEGHDDAGLRFESYPLLHVGSDGVRRFGQRYSALLQEQGVTVMTGVEARELLITDGRAAGAVLYDSHARLEWSIGCGFVVMAAGLIGTVWLEDQLRLAGVALGTGPADIGIRLETSAAALGPFIDAFYDFKVEHTSPAGITLRSFCVNGNGFVVNEYHRPLGIRGVNGHSFLDRKSGMSNLAILATIDQAFTSDPKAYVREVAARVNSGAGGYPVHQTLAEFLPGASAPPLRITPSNPKTRPARLDQLLPAVLREAFASFLRALGRVLPPVLASDSVIYAPEIKYYNYRVPIDFGSWESTDISGLFVVGNAAGYTASLSAAALSGIIAARAIAARAHLFPAECCR